MEPTQASPATCGVSSAPGCSAPFTAEDVVSCWEYASDYLADILNGEYAVEKAREDLRSLIGSRHDRRTELTDEIRKRLYGFANECRRNAGLGDSQPNPVVTVAPLGARKVDDVVQILNK